MRQQCELQKSRSFHCFVHCASLAPRKCLENSRHSNFLKGMNGCTHRQNIHKAFPANSWNVSRMQGASWGRDAGLRVIRNLVYLVISWLPHGRRQEKMSKKRSLAWTAMPSGLGRTLRRSSNPITLPLHRGAVQLSISISLAIMGNSFLQQHTSLNFCGY